MSYWRLVMARGNSGRIVLEIDPKIKNKLYETLVKQNITLKGWFLLQCESYLSDSIQLKLFSEVAAEPTISYVKKGIRK